MIELLRVENERPGSAKTGNYPRHGLATTAAQPTPNAPGGTSKVRHARAGPAAIRVGAGSRAVLVIIDVLGVDAQVRILNRALAGSGAQRGDGGGRVRRSG